MPVINGKNIIPNVTGHRRGRTAFYRAYNRNGSEKHYHSHNVVDSGKRYKRIRYRPRVLYSFTIDNAGAGAVASAMPPNIKAR